MSNVTSRKYKELESRLEDIEKWLKERKDDLERLTMLENYSFLIKALKDYVDRQEQLGQQMQHMQGQFQTNIASVEKFIEKQQKEAEEEAKKQQAMAEGPEIKSASEIISEQRGMSKE
jgi:cytochrome c553